MMRIASKSVIGPESSNGFERNKATLLGGPFGQSPRLSRFSNYSAPKPPHSSGFFHQEKAALNNAGKAAYIGKTPFFPGFFKSSSFPGSGVTRFQEEP
jgi:hypothetical protein